MVFFPSGQPVALVFTGHGIFHPFGDVDGVVRAALEILGDHQHIQQLLMRSIWGTHQRSKNLEKLIWQVELKR